MSSIAVIPKPAATNLLVGNLNPETMDSVYGEVPSIDCLIFAHTNSRSKIQAILAGEATRTNQSNCDVPVQQAAAPKAGVPRVGDVDTLLDFKKLLVNIINTGPLMVDTKAMKAAGSPRLLTTIAEGFLDIMGPDFDKWVEATGGGPWIHALLLQYFDVVFSRFCEFAIDFQNGNVFQFKRAASELDAAPLSKAILAWQHARDHFQSLIAIK